MERLQQILTLWARKRYYVFSAGGIKGLGHFGALEQVIYWLCEVGNKFEGHEILFSQLRGTIGSSIGAVLALCVACKASVSMIKHILIDFDFVHKIKNNLECASNSNIIGLIDSSVLLEYSEWILQELGFKPNISFEDLYKYTGIEYRCTAVAIKDINVNEEYETNSSDSNMLFSFSESKLLTFSSLIYPHYSVAEATTASMCAPGIFTPFKGDIGKSLGCLLVDGGCIASCPTHIYPIEESLIFRLVSNYSNDSQIFFHQKRQNSKSENDKNSKKKQDNDDSSTKNQQQKKITKDKPLAAETTTRKSKSILSDHVIKLVYDHKSECTTKEEERENDVTEYTTNSTIQKLRENVQKYHQQTGQKDNINLSKSSFFGQGFNILNTNSIKQQLIFLYRLTCAPAAYIDENNYHAIPYEMRKYCVINIYIKDVFSFDITLDNDEKNKLIEQGKKAVDIYLLAPVLTMEKNKK